MRLPRLVILLGYGGLIPFIAGPLWLTLAPAGAPDWLDRAWLSFIGMIAAFLAGTFWGFALPAAEGRAGTIGLLLSMLLAGLSWLAVTLPLHAALPGLATVFLLLLLADFWRERTLGEVEGYFRLRAVLTFGACLAIAWRLAL